MNYYPMNFGQVTDGQTESDTYEPTVPVVVSRGYDTCFGERLVMGYEDY